MRSAPRARPSIVSIVACLVLLLAAPAAGAAEDGWSRKHFEAVGASLLVHDKLEPLEVRDAPGGATQVARWRWPHANKIFVAIETLPLAAGKPLTSLLEEMDGKPRREPRDDGAPAIRTETIFEGVLERRFWVHDRARGRVVRISIAILGVENWMQRKPLDIHREFANPLWVPTKMFRSLRFER